MGDVRIPLLPSPLRWLGVVVIATVLVYFSLVTVPPPEPPTDGPLGAGFWDKKLHFAGYATLGLSLIYATAGSRTPWARRVAVSVGLAVAFGVLIELLQGPLPHRYFSYGDMLANAIGALIATAWFVVESRLEYVRFPD